MSAMPLKRRLAEAVAQNGDAEETGARRPSLGHIEDALLALSGMERLTLALRYYEKLSESEVAQVLRLQVSEVKRIQQKAIDGVVRYLSGQKTP